MIPIDNWIGKHKKPFAFYTDDKGRKRPITKRKNSTEK
jgi:hypothetical protein